MDFKLDKQMVLVTKFNPRNEAAGENKRANVGTDINILAEKLDARYLRVLQPTDQGMDVDAFTAFFTKDGTPRFRSIGIVHFDYEHKNVEVTLAGHEFTRAAVGSFRVVKFNDGGTVDLAFQIQVHPTDDDGAMLMKQMRANGSELSLNPMQRELPLGEEEEEEQE